LLCGLSYCPLLRLPAPARQPPMELFGSTPPSVFVGRVGYPRVRVYPSAPPVAGDTSIYENPKAWLSLPIERFVELRLSLFRGGMEVDVDKPSRLGEIQALALSQRPVDVEMRFAKRPAGVYLSEYAPPMGPAAPLKEFKPAGNPSLPRAAEEALSDVDMGAHEAVVKLYLAGLDVSYISRALSIGALGRRRRRLVPTRWAITAVDKAVSDFLLSKVKQFPEVDGYYLYARYAERNLFVAILAPAKWAYEWGEAFEPRTVWNPGGSVEVEVDYELFQGRRDYPEIGGCYYAARLAAVEHLYAIRRQAAVIIWREVYTGFTTPTGVWWVRENVRAMFEGEPVRFDTLDEALEAASHLLKYSSTWLRASKLLPVLKSRLYGVHGTA